LHSASGKIFTYDAPALHFLGTGNGEHWSLQRVSTFGSAKRFLHSRKEELMHTLLARLLAPPQSHSYEATQKAKLVYFMLLAAFLGMLASATVNFVRGDVRLATILVAFAAICLVGLYLNQIHHADLAAFPLCASLFVVIDVAIYNGISLHDASVMAYPVFILCTTFLFRERGLLVATILSIGCLAAFYLLEARGLLVSSYHSTPNRLIILSILVIALAMTVWVVEVFATLLREGEPGLHS